jgi:hypothetical protein
MLRVWVKPARKSKNERFRDVSMKCTVYIEKTRGRPEKLRVNAVAMSKQNKTRVTKLDICHIVISTKYQYFYKQDWSYMTGEKRPGSGAKKLETVTFSTFK